jgi:diacylglycerol kinase (ATP)
MAMKNDWIFTNKRTNGFSLRARLRSFGYAIEGLKTFFVSQPNAIIHLLLTLMAFSGAVFCNVSVAEAVALILSAASVWAAELFNTAIEKLADTISSEFHPGIKFIKDVAAAAVLVTAIAAFLVGAIIFLPKLFP